MQHRGFSGVTHGPSCHCNSLRQIVCTFPAKNARYVSVFRSGGDYLSDVLASIFTPIPHKERVCSMIGISSPVHLNVTGIICELLFVLLTQRKGVASFG